MVYDEDEDFSKDGGPVREVVPLPPGFPDDKMPGVNAGDMGVFDIESRPTGARATEVCETMVQMIVHSVFISNYDSEWIFRERETILPLLREAYDQMAQAGESKPARLLEVRRFLWLVGAPEGSRWMAESLDVGQPEKNKILHDLRHFVVFYGEKASLKCEEPLISALRQIWTDPETRDDALTTALGLGVPEASLALLEVVRGPDKFPSIYLFGKGWDAAQQEAAIRAIERRLETSDEAETVDLLRSLQSVWIETTEEEKVPPEMKQLAIQVAEDFLLNPARAHREKAIDVLRTKGSSRCLPRPNAWLSRRRIPARSASMPVGRQPDPP